MTGFPRRARHAAADPCYPPCQENCEVWHFVRREEDGLPTACAQRNTDPCYSPCLVRTHLVGVRATQQQTRFGAAMAFELPEVVVENLRTVKV